MKLGYNLFLYRQQLKNRNPGLEANKNYIDVTGDTLIFEAEKYFQNKFDDNQAALAHYYAANVHIERNNASDGLTSLLHCEHWAKLTDNKLLIAKSQHSIGNSYRIQYIDSLAIKYYKKSLKQYEKTENTDEYQLQVLRLLGISNISINNTDSAFYYYNKGLNLASETDSKYYQFQFIQEIDIVNSINKEYNRAVTNYNNAIPLASTKADSTRIYLNLAIVYNSKQQSDSAKYYTDFVVDGLPLVKDKKVLRTMYGALADYNTQIGNDAEANRYNILRYNINQEIMNSNSAVELLKAEQNFKYTIQQKEAANKNLLTIVLVVFLVFILLLMTVLILYLRLRHRMQLETEKNKILEAKSIALDEKMKAILTLQTISNDTVNEWIEIDKDVEKLAEELGAKEKPELYQRIEKMVKDLKSKTEEQRTEWAKEYLIKYPFDAEFINSLNHKQQLLLVLCCCGFSETHIASILDTKENSIFSKQMTLLCKLLKTGMSMPEVDKIIFPNR